MLVPSCNAFFQAILTTKGHGVSILHKVSSCQLLSGMVGSFWTHGHILILRKMSSSNTLLLTNSCAWPCISPRFFFIIIFFFVFFFFFVTFIRILLLQCHPDFCIVLFKLSLFLNKFVSCSREII